MPTEGNWFLEPSDFSGGRVGAAVRWGSGDAFLRVGSGLCWLFLVLMDFVEVTLVNKIT